MPLCPCPSSVVFWTFAINQWRQISTQTHSKTHHFLSAFFISIWGFLLMGQNYNNTILFSYVCVHICICCFLVFFCPLCLSSGTILWVSLPSWNLWFPLELLRSGEEFSSLCSLFHVWVLKGFIRVPIWEKNNSKAFPFWRVLKQGQGRFPDSILFSYTFLLFNSQWRGKIYFLFYLISK